MVFYVDTSSVLKLLVDETHSTAMREWFAGHEAVWSSQLLRTEALRAARRLGVTDEAVEEVLAGISLILPSAATFGVAGGLEPQSLRSLDALHLATALELGGDLEGLVAYDRNMIDGARAASVPVLSPT